MKVKRIPRIIRIWLLLAGYWVGSLATVVLMAFWITGSNLGFYGLIASFTVTMLLLIGISSKYRTTFEEYGIFEKETKKR
jgi:hypothetical protein